MSDTSELIQQATAHIEQLERELAAKDALIERMSVAARNDASRLEVLHNAYEEEHLRRLQLQQAVQDRDTLIATLRAAIDAARKATP